MIQSVHSHRQIDSLEELQFLQSQQQEWYAANSFSKLMSKEQR